MRCAAECMVQLTRYAALRECDSGVARICRDHALAPLSRDLAGAGNELRGVCKAAMCPDSSPRAARAAQNAASYADLGVVTSLVQFSRALGSTLGSAVLGSILVWKLMPQPEVVPQPAALAAALRWVFVCCAAVMASGFVAGLFVHDVPFRRGHTDPAATDSRPAT